MVIRMVNPRHVQNLIKKAFEMFLEPYTYFDNVTNEQIEKDFLDVVKITLRQLKDEHGKKGQQEPSR